MKDDILARARFLLIDLHLPPVEADSWLKDYYPDLEFEERTRYLRAAGTTPASDGG